MAKGRFPPDRGLTLRILVVLLLIAGFYAGVIALCAMLNPGVIAPLFVLAVALTAVQHFSMWSALRRFQAAPPKPGEVPELVALLKRLCALADVREPKLVISPVKMPNAFIVGRTLCVTRGLLKRLTPEETEAVLAHELAHRAHRDSIVLHAAASIGLAFAVVLSGGGHREDEGRGWKALTYFAMWPLLLFLGWIVLFSKLLTGLLSRYRELAADRAAAALSGRPATLASALSKMSVAEGIPRQDLRTARAYSLVMCVEPEGGKRSFFGRLFASHPPLPRRLDQLARMSGTREVR